MGANSELELSPVLGLHTQQRIGSAGICAEFFLLEFYAPMLIFSFSVTTGTLKEKE